MASVTFEHVTKRFGDVVAVNDLNIEVADREFLVFVGPGVWQDHLVAAAGRPGGRQRGRHLYRRPPGQRCTRQRPQHRHGIPELCALSLHERLRKHAFGLKLRKTPKAEIDRRVREAATRWASRICWIASPRPSPAASASACPGARHRARPERLSHGQPLSNLDAKLRVATRAELSKLHQRLETTFIYVTHDQMEAMTMGTRIAVMRDGILQQVDTPESLYSRPPTCSWRFHRQPGHELFRRHPHGRP
jgi:multiple sugar transport system ATP-binding protein